MRNSKTSLGISMSMPPKNKNVHKTIFLVRAERTDLVRYVSGMSDLPHRKVIVKAKYVLAQSKNSSIGNATNYRANNLWPQLRASFLNSGSFIVEQTAYLIKPEDGRTIQHVVAELNRKALREAKISK